MPPISIYSELCVTFFVPNRKKLDPRCKRGYFIGYDRQSLAYLVYHNENRTAMKYRLVTLNFKECDWRITPPQVDSSSKRAIPELPEAKPECRYPLRERKSPVYHGIDRTEKFDDSDNINHIDYFYMMLTPTTYKRVMNTRDKDLFIFPNRLYINTPKQMNMNIHKHITINKDKTGISVPYLR